jgi:hypothetical protein
MNAIIPTGGGSSSMKMDFQVGVDKEDVNDGLIIIILNFNNQPRAEWWQIM